MTIETLADLRGTAVNWQGILAGMDLTPTPLTLGVGAVALNVTTVPLVNGLRRLALTSDAGANTIASITGLGAGELLLIRSIDALTSFTTAAAKFRNNQAYTPLAGDVILLFNDGTNKREVSRAEASFAATPVTLGVGAATLGLNLAPAYCNVRSQVVTGDGSGNTVTSFTGLGVGEFALLRFIDNKVTITTAAAKFLSNVNFVSNAGDMMLLYNDGTNLRELSRSRAGALATSTRSVASPTGTTSATQVMMGLAGALTPTRTGKVKIAINGVIGNGAIGDGASVQLSYGTGAVPSNGDAVTGTQVGSVKHMVASTAAGKQGFALEWIVSGLALGTAIWIDAALNAVTGNTATIYDVDIIAIELPE